MANSVDPNQTAPIGAVCSGTKLFAFILNSSVMLAILLQQTTSTDNIFKMHFFLGALRANCICTCIWLHSYDFAVKIRTTLGSSAR